MNVKCKKIKLSIFAAIVILAGFGFASEAAATVTYYIQSKLSTTANSVDGWGSASNLSDASNTNANVYGTVVPLAGGDMYAIYIASTSITGIKYTSGSGWGATTTIATGKTGMANNMSAVSDSSGNIHLTYIDSLSYVQYQKYTTSWQTAVALDSNATNEYTTLAIDTAGNNGLYAFWVRANDILYRRGCSPYALADWDATSTFESAGGNSNNWTVAGYKDFGSGKIFAEWTQGAASPYSIKWKSLTPTSCVTGINISGNIYLADETTQNATSFTIALSVNNGATTTVTATSTYTFSTVTVASGDSIAVYIEGTTTDANTFTVTDGLTNATSVDLYLGKVAIGNNNSSTTLNSDICKQSNYPTTTDNLLFCSVNNITATSGVEVHILQNKKYDTGIGATLTTQGAGGDLHLSTSSQATLSATTTISGNVTISSGATSTIYATTTLINVSVGGNWTNSGNFTANTSTVTFTATASGKTITTGGSPFYNLTFDGSGGEWTLQDALDVNNNLNLTAGTLIASSQNINIAGDLTLASGGYFTKGTGTLTFDGSTAKTWTDNNATKQDMGSVIIDGSSKTINLGSDVKITKLTIGLDDTFGAESYTFTITGLGTGASRPFLINSGGTFNASTSLAEFIATSTTDIESTTYYNLKLNQAGTTFQLYNNVTTTNDINIAAGTLDVTVANYNLVIGGNWSNSGTFLAQSGMVTFNATSTGKTIATGGIGNPFYNLTFNGLGGGWQLATSTAINANVTTTEGSLELNSQNLTVDGGTISGTNGSITCSGCTAGTTTLSGIGNLGPTGTGSYTFYNLTLSGSGVTTLAGNINVNSILTISSGKSLDASNKTINLYGSGTGSAKPFVIEGTFTYNQSTVIYRGSAATDITSATYYNLTASSTGVTFTLAGNTTTTNNLNITAGTLDVTTNNYPLWIGGNWSNSGSFNCRNGTTTFDATSGTVTIDSTTSTLDDFYNIVFDDGGGSATFQLESTLDVNNDLIINGGNLDVKSGENNTIYVKGSWDNNDIFTRQQGEVIFDATSSETITDGGWPFNLLTFNSSDGNGSWLYQDSTSTALATTTVQAGIATFLNAKTGGVSVTGGTLNVDWYLGVHVVDADSTSTNINTTGTDPITISEASSSAAIWRHNGTNWVGPVSSTSTDSGDSGKNPQPNDSGAIRIREYSNSTGTATYYKFNLTITAQSGYGAYNYSADHRNGKFIISTLYTGGDQDDCISQTWHRTTISALNEPYPTVNNPPDKGSWFVGMASTLEFSVSATSTYLGSLDYGNDFTAIGTTTLSVTTTAYNGYVVKAYANNLGRLKLGVTENYIDRWIRAGATNATPTSWDINCSTSTDYCAFGYTTSDDTLSGGTLYRFTDYNFCSAAVGNKCWAGFATSSLSTDPIADATSSVSGAQTTITYKVSADEDYVAGTYSTKIYYICTANL